MRTLAVAFVVAVASLSSATAQQPTVPATLDFTCASRIPNSLAESRIEATLHGA